ncbi:MAG: MFS transporter [Acetobacteraceae bacterium]|nr:MFS transporter [Acetobacteraceae bacterium]
MRGEIASTGGRRRGIVTVVSTSGEASGIGDSGGRVLSRLLPLYGVIFAGFIGYSLMITVFTPLLLRPDSLLAGGARTPGTRALVLGGLLALYPLGQFLSSPVMGALSDRRGRRPVLVISLLATTVCYALIVLALRTDRLGLLAFACLCAGLGEANIVCAQGAIADLTPAEQRGRYFGYIYLSASLAYIVGPLIGGKLAEPAIVPWFGPDIPFAVVFVLLAVITTTVALGFRETRTMPVAGAAAGPGSSLAALRVVFRPGLGRFFAFNLLCYLAVFGFFRSYPMYLAQAFHFGVSRISEFVAWVGVPIVLVNAGVTGRLTARAGPRMTALAAATASGCLIAAVVLPRATAALWPILFLVGAAVALLLPACAMLLSAQVGPDEQGRVMGGNQALQVGAEAVSGALSGALAAVSPLLPLPVLGAAALLGAVWLLAVRPARALTLRSESRDPF